jgi:hypothetical protein
MAMISLISKLILNKVLWSYNKQINISNNIHCPNGYMNQLPVFKNIEVAINLFLKY